MNVSGTFTWAVFKPIVIFQWYACWVHWSGCSLQSLCNWVQAFSFPYKLRNITTQDTSAVSLDDICFCQSYDVKYHAYTIQRLIWFSMFCLRVRLISPISQQPYLITWIMIRCKHCGCLFLGAMFASWIYWLVIFPLAVVALSNSWNVFAAAPPRRGRGQQNGYLFIKARLDGTLPICSMYGIFLYIWFIFMVNV